MTPMNPPYATPRGEDAPSRDGPAAADEAADGADRAAWANLRRPRLDPSRYDDAADRFGVTEEGLAALAAPREVAPDRPAASSTVPTAFTPDLDDAAFAALVVRLKEEIAAGEVYQIVPSRTFRGPCPDPLGAYARLRLAEPASYRFFLAGERFVLLGASPETSVRLSSGGPGGGASAMLHSS